MALDEEKYILFTTFRADGTPVSTPVWIVPLDDGTFGFWTSSGSGKAKRLAHTDRVTVQPCDARGKVKQGSVELAATARLVEGSEMAPVAAKIKAKYGAMTSISKWLGSIVAAVKRRPMPYGDRGVIITLTA
jgi:hypothetical protein